MKKILMIVVVLTMMFAATPAVAARKASVPPAPTAQPAPPAPQQPKKEETGKEMAKRVGLTVLGAAGDAAVWFGRSWMKGWSKPLPQNSPQARPHGGKVEVIQVPGAIIVKSCQHCAR